MVWIEANLSALLQAILYKLNKENQLVFRFDISLIENRFPILFRNGFLSSLLDLPDGVGTTVEMQNFSPDEDVKFYNYINDKLLEHPKMQRHGCSELVGHYLEVFANVKRHAKTTEPVFACGQFYPSTKKLYFTLVDLGVGYLPPIQKYTNGIICTSKEAIEWALQRGNTTKGLEETGGLGLNELFNHCEQTGGQFNIVTGNAYWGNNLGELGPRIVPEFAGTTIHLIYNCK